MSEEPINIGVLASGRGSNFAALLKHQEQGYFEKARLACLVSNIPSAGALQIATDAGLPALCIRPKEYTLPQQYEAALVAEMDQHSVEWLALAGYMKIVGPTLLGRYPDRIINIHPSLLPAFPGLHAQRQALEHGVRVSGCTVHFVDAGMDTGPIIGQRSVPVHTLDTEAMLSARILEQEHQLYAECLKSITERPWHLDGRRVIFD
ncbi:MAG: phosphoribosylglycinamide formyltransferase [Candidatus Sumerlaeaceae bacterium]